MKQKIQTLLADMNTGLIDRQHALKAALLTVLASENMVLIGPPGTAKSMVARRVAQHIQTSDGAHPPGDGADSYFEYLLTKFSTPEEIFGPLSITELKADRFRRNTAGYLPTAQVAFLDEIFKSSSSILNALLTILNERIFHNGNQPQRVPLRSLISASNELPTGQDELSALYDRFLIRCFVGPVPEEHLHLLFNAPGAAHQASVQLTQCDFQAVDAAAQQVGISPEVGEAIRGIWAAHKEAFKEDRREYLSDRRLVKLLKLLRVSAATNQRTEVDLSDAMLLQHCLWNHPDNMAKVREIVITTLQQHSPKVPVQATAVALSRAVVYPIMKKTSMSLIEIKVPDIGDFAEVTVIELMVKPGDSVKADQSLMTVESDKASMEIPSSHAGMVKEFKVKLGDKVKEGSLVLLLEVADSAAASTVSTPKQALKTVNTDISAIDLIVKQVQANIWL